MSGSAAGCGVELADEPAGVVARPAAVVAEHLDRACVVGVVNRLDVEVERGAVVHHGSES